MPRYRVFVREVHIQPYDIIALSDEDAVRLVYRGQGEFVEDAGEFSHFVDKEDWIVEELEHEWFPTLSSLPGEPRCRESEQKGDDA